jgi:hypothetical protein
MAGEKDESLPDLEPAQLTFVAVACAEVHQEPIW